MFFIDISFRGKEYMPVLPLNEYNIVYPITNASFSKYIS